MKFRFSAAVLAACLPVALGAVVVSASAIAETTLKDGVYTQAQADKGKTSYEANCKSCHAPEFYREQLRNWNQVPLIEFYDLVSATMPGDRPGALELQDYTDAMAHIFSLLGYPAGDKVLNQDDGSMEKILIVVD